MRYVILSVLLALAVGARAQTTPYEVVGSSRANVRVEPNTNSSVIAQLNPGARVDVAGEVDGTAVAGSVIWYRVQVDGQTGYVHSSLLRPAALSESLAAAPNRGIPANPNASASARAVLRYLNGLTGRTNNRVISGQFGAYGDGTSAATAAEQLQKIVDQTGLYPALTGMDYMRWDMDHGNNFAEPNQFLIDAWNAGSLVNLSWHANNPWTGGGSNDWANPATENPYDTRPVIDLLTAGNPAAERWRAMLDNIAVGLQQLEDAGVVVIWRPLHEMNGGWAWWHRQAPEQYAALWRDMFDYFTVTKGLDHLLWAYTPMMNGSGSDPSPAAFYPGGGYVDLVGLDKYMDIGEDPLDLNHWGEYDALVALNKPMGLFEFGPLPASGEGWDSIRYDYANLIRDIRNLYPQIVLFQAWEYVWQIGDHTNAAGLLSDPWVVTRDELPGF